MSPSDESRPSSVTLRRGRIRRWSGNGPVLPRAAREGRGFLVPSAALALAGAVLRTAARGHAAAAGGTAAAALVGALLAGAIEEGVERRGGARAGVDHAALPAGAHVDPAVAGAGRLTRRAGAHAGQSVQARV